jgi:D-alanyl-D-alanine carboxypeptidase (penicillin-binding protein 5/6)
LIDAKTGQVLYEKNADDKLPPASITKIMTMLIAVEKIEAGELSLSDPVTVSAYAANMGGSQLYLEAGEVRTVEELFYGIAVESGNDAATALAEHIGGSIDGFVALMNAHAAELGMTNTHFCDACGLTEEGHYTTARDIATNVGWYYSSMIWFIRSHNLDEGYLCREEQRRLEDACQYE